jgi:hypothetical protein
MTNGDIADGFTLPGYIAAIDGVSSAIRFRYRPISGIENAKLGVRKRAIQNNQSKSEEEIAVALVMAECQEIADHVFEWDFARLGEAAGPPKPDAATIAGKTSPYQYTRLLDVVMFGSASDKDPQASTSAKPKDETGNVKVAKGN